MKKSWLLLVLLTAAAAAQQAAPPPVQPTNLVEKPVAPTYSDIYCAGFVTNQPIATSNFVAGGSGTPNVSMYVDRDTVFLKGSGYEANQLFSVVRLVRDPIHFHAFAGQADLLARMGQPYAQLGRLRVLKVEGEMAVAQVEFSCQPISPGDLVLPFEEHPPVPFRAEKISFDRFPGQGAPTGRIVLAKDFDAFISTGSKVYINAGVQKGIHVGDYLRVTRGYTVADMDSAAALGYDTIRGLETQKNAPKFGKEERKQLPREAVGEMIVLSVTPTSATGMITVALDAIRVGDTVEVETPHQ